MQNKARFILLILISIIWIGLGVPVQPLADQGGIVLNSDSSIKKYNLAMDSFVASVPEKVRQYNMADNDSLQAVKRDLASLNPLYVYAIGSRAAMWAQEEAKDEIRIISSVLNPASFSTGNSVYCISSQPSPATKMTLYRHIFPSLKTIGILYSTKYNTMLIEEVRKEAVGLQLEIKEGVVNKTEDLEDVLETLLSNVDCLWLVPDPVVFSGKKSVNEIFSRAEASQTPVFAYSPAFAPFEPTLIVSVDSATTGRQVASLVHIIKQGDNVGQNIFYPAGSNIILNMKKVQQYRLHFNEQSLSNINQIIE